MTRFKKMMKARTALAMLESTPKISKAITSVNISSYTHRITRTKMWQVILLVLCHLASTSVLDSCDTERATPSRFGLKSTGCT